MTLTEKLEKYNFNEQQIILIIDLINKEKLKSKQAIFKKFDKYAIIKNDKWYLDYKEEVL